jgi:hypothetical protein
MTSPAVKLAPLMLVAPLAGLLGPALAASVVALKLKVLVAASKRAPIASIAHKKKPPMRNLIFILETKAGEQIQKNGLINRLPK